MVFLLLLRSWISVVYEKEKYKDTPKQNVINSFISCKS